MTTTTATGESISRLRVPAQDELNGKSRKLFETTREQEGHVPNWLSAFALGGDHFNRLSDYLLPLLSNANGRLSLREREIIATVVSVENRCSYCHTLHIHSLAQVIGDKWLAERIGLDHREVRELSDRERALAALSITITHAPRDVGEDDFAELRSLSLTDEDIFEAVQIASIINATNRITLALGVLPDREIFDS